MMAKRVGDTLLPLALVQAGTFSDTDPKSGCHAEDRKAAIELSARMKENIKGNLRDDEEYNEDEDEDEEQEVEGNKE